MLYSYILTLKTSAIKPTNATVHLKIFQTLNQILGAELVVRSSAFFSICVVTYSRCYFDCTHWLDKPDLPHSKMFLNALTISRMYDVTRNFAHWELK